jgi:hypothetical protein
MIIPNFRFSNYDHSSYDHLEHIIELAYQKDKPDSIAFQALLCDVNHETLHALIHNEVNLDACKAFDSIAPAIDRFSGILTPQLLEHYPRVDAYLQSRFQTWVEVADKK